MSTPYGSRSAAQAYNPYTGSYAATAQGSSPGAQWGSSVVTKGNQAAYTQHYSTAQGTVASAQTSSGGQAAGVSGARGSTGAGKTASGDMYAGKDGNVYKNTGSGWQKYDEGSWNSVNKPTSASVQHSAQSAQAQRTASGQPPATGQAATSAQQHTQTALSQRLTQASTGAYSRSGGGFSSPELNQEMQNRQRGASQSPRYQQAGGGSWGGSGRRRR